MLEDALLVKQKAKADLETITAHDMNELGYYLKLTPLIQLILDCALIFSDAPSFHTRQRTTK